MIQGLFTPGEVSDMILAGKHLLLAGDAKLLKHLPKGDWIGGSTPYFIVQPGIRTTSFDKIFVNKLPDCVTKTEIAEYDETDIQNIFTDGTHNGLTVLILPYSSPVSNEYARNATRYPNFAMHPVFGWLTGEEMGVVHTGEERSFTISGLGNGLSTKKAVAMRITLPKTKYAEIQIFNPFKQGSGDKIEFDCSELTVRDAIINGEKRNFAEYLRENNIDLNMPMSANYSGTLLNNVVVAVVEDGVMLSAPAFENLEYRFAELDPDVTEPSLINDKIFFAASCVAYFLQPALSDKYLRQINCPIVFGEIAYQMVGMTTIYVTIDDTPVNN
jgi:hypothetical protein